MSKLGECCYIRVLEMYANFHLGTLRCLLSCLLMLSVTRTTNRIDLKFATCEYNLKIYWFYSIILNHFAL